jgi:hypothetical protein
MSLNILEFVILYFSNKLLQCEKYSIIRSYRRLDCSGVERSGLHPKNIINMFLNVGPFSNENLLS